MLVNAAVEKFLKYLRVEIVACTDHLNSKVSHSRYYRQRRETLEEVLQKFEEFFGIIP